MVTHTEQTYLGDICCLMLVVCWYYFLLLICPRVVLFLSYTFLLGPISFLVKKATETEIKETKKRY